MASPAERAEKASELRREAYEFLSGSGLFDLLADDAELRIGSDDPTYIAWALAHVTDHPAFRWLAEAPSDWSRRPADWPATRYERKAVLAGRKPAYFRFRRRPR